MGHREQGREDGAVGSWQIAVGRWQLVQSGGVWSFASRHSLSLALRASFGCKLLNDY